MQQARKDFDAIYLLAVNGQAYKIKAEQVQEHRDKLKLLAVHLDAQRETSEVQSMIRKYDELQRIIRQCRTQVTTQEELQARVREVFEATSHVQLMGENQEQNDVKSQLRTQQILIDSQQQKSIKNLLKVSDAEKGIVSFKKVLQGKEFAFLNQGPHSSKVSSSRSRSMLQKKSVEKELQIKRLIEQNRKITEQLQSKSKQESQLNEFEKNLLKEEKNRCMAKIQELQGEIEMLCRDNYRLKEIEKSQKGSSLRTDTFEEKKETINEPYVIKTRSNNLQLINEKNRTNKQSGVVSGTPSRYDDYQNQPGDHLGRKLQANSALPRSKSSVRPLKEISRDQELKQFILKDLLEQEQQCQHSQQRKPHNQVDSLRRNDPRCVQPAGKLNTNPPKLQLPPSNTFDQSYQYLERGSHFDTFQMAENSNFVRESQLGESRQQHHLTSTECTRNKVAFFKNSLVLVRNSILQIAFKRSSLSETMDRIRLIFYIHNKQNKPVSASIEYDYQQEYFNVVVCEKLDWIASNQQGREVIEVTLRAEKDLNGVSDVHIRIDNSQYDIWLPLTFINFITDSRLQRLKSGEAEMIIVPDKQFSSVDQAGKVLPLVFKGKNSNESWGYLIGRCKMGQYTIKLTWRNRQLTIETTDKWIDLIGFILHFFK